MPSGAGRKALLIGLAACLAVATDASAAQRFAAPGADPAAPCSAAQPCSLDRAVTGSGVGDDVVVAPGDYAITKTIDAKNGIGLHGVAGQPRPRLIGDATLPKPVVASAGGTVRHLEIHAEGTGVDADALLLHSGLGEDLILDAADGDGAAVESSAAGTVLRDSVVTTAGLTSNAAGVDMRGDKANGPRLVNLTVLATRGQATGVYCGGTGGPGTIVNSYVRGAQADIDATVGAAPCSATASDFRLALSPGLAAGTSSVTADAVFADAAAGDLRTLAGSATIDAGMPDPSLGTSDAAGCPRSLGAGPDIGAFEYAEPFGTCGLAATPPPVSAPGPTSSPTPDPDSTPTPAPAQPAAPQDPPRRNPAAHDPDPVPIAHLGSSVVVSAPRGTVRVRSPHGRHFRRLDAATRVPVGTTVDATHGRVRLVSAIDAHGTQQVGTFWGTRFQVSQRRHDRGMTTLKMVHAAGCGHPDRPAATPTASAARHRRGRHHAHRHHRHRRSLWAHDNHGRFRTRGSSSVATARGTAWLTQERCTGTFTRVMRGAVAVRDRVRHRTVLVRAGHSYLARRRG